ACGALESPGLLLRSQIGGPAAGQYLRLHPANAVVGLYPEPQEPWWGAPQTALVDEFVNAEADHGFLVEGAQYGPGIFGSSIPFTTAAEHKSALQRFRHGASFVALIRDRGYGRVEIDAAGQPVHWYSLTDELDIRNTFRS